MDEPVTYDELEAALDVIAAWLIASYGWRLERVSLSLEGYYGPITECYGIVPITIGRGTRPDGTAESRDTLPTREIRDRAEALLARLVPGVVCTHDPVRDVCHVVSSSLVKAEDVSAHRRIELLRRYGRSMA
jgi:hypothetical protein